MVRRRRTSVRKYARKTNNMVNSGLIHPSGLLQKALLGAGASAIAEKFLPQVVPYQNVAVGFAVGGIGGAGGALIKDMVGGFKSSGTGTPLNY